MQLVAIKSCEWVKNQTELVFC